MHKTKSTSETTEWHDVKFAARTLVARASGSDWLAKLQLQQYNMLSDADTHS